MAIGVLITAVIIVATVLAIIPVAISVIMIVSIMVMPIVIMPVVIVLPDYGHFAVPVIVTTTRRHQRCRGQTWYEYRSQFDSCAWSH